MEFYVPSYMKELASRYWRDFDNFSLKLDKFVLFVEDRSSGVKKPRIDKFGTKINLPNVALEIYEKFFNLQKSLWKSKIEEFDGNPNEFVFTMKTKSRLVIGLGDESVYETSIRLHRNYGVPYIPGSALKGVAKHYVILNLADWLMENNPSEDLFNLSKKVQDALETAVNNENDEKAVEKVIKEKLNVKDVPNDIVDEFKLLRKIFGTQSYEGSIIFFDAFLTYDCLKKRAENKEPILELDVMNPHYQPYYSASDSELRTNPEKAPGDWHSPVPVFFLAVPEGIEFQFAIAPRREEVKLLDKAKELLISALREHGVGAKTALGYGRLG